jgi:hypothetical protein
MQYRRHGPLYHPPLIPLLLGRRTGKGPLLGGGVPHPLGERGIFAEKCGVNPDSGILHLIPLVTERISGMHGSGILDANPAIIIASGTLRE